MWPGITHDLDRFRDRSASCRACCPGPVSEASSAERRRGQACCGCPGLRPCVQAADLGTDTRVLRRDRGTGRANPPGDLCRGEPLPAHGAAALRCCHFWLDLDLRGPRPPVRPSIRSPERTRHVPSGARTRELRGRSHRRPPVAFASEPNLMTHSHAPIANPITEWTSMTAGGRGG